jgi:hypothetical protein
MGDWKLLKVGIYSRKQKKYQKHVKKELQRSFLQKFPVFS